ncbi:MAG: hypothetical protein LBI54_06115 [Lachnospiraceae bacterium]|nr:hypothetical protein [Lachnospiraceae bacterium]
MDRTGLIARVFDSETTIEKGRRWLYMEGFEHEGRCSYHEGLDIAMQAFQDAQNAAREDLELVILAEYTFLTQELQFCEPADTLTISSLKQALQSFDDALLSLRAVEQSGAYQFVDMTYPHNAKYRFKGMPRDAFHIACLAHRTRIANILRTPGLN